MEGSVSLEDLPDEVLSIIFTFLPTHCLLHILRVNKRFFACIRSLFHVRLRHALAEPDYSMVLECYPETTRLTAPTLMCHYLGTTGDTRRVSTPDAGSGGPPVGDPRRWHLWFKPDLRTPRVLRDKLEDAVEGGEYSMEVNFAENEDSSHLLTRTILKRRETKGLYPSYVTVHEGRLKVSREWLAAASAPIQEQDGDFNVLWTSSSKHMGVRLQVAPAASARMPVLIGVDDKPPVAYKLTFKGVAVSGILFLLAYEQSCIESIDVSGRSLTIVHVPA